MTGLRLFLKFSISELQNSVWGQHAFRENKRWRLWSTVPRAPAEKKSQPAAFLLFTLLREKHSRVLSRIYFPHWNTRSHSLRVILLTLLYARLYRTLYIQLERYHRQVLEIPRAETFQRKMGGTSIRIIHLIYSDGFLNLLRRLVNGSHCFNSLPLPYCFFMPPPYTFISLQRLSPLQRKCSYNGSYRCSLLITDFELFIRLRRL